MTTVAILNNVQPYEDFLHELHQRETKALSKNPGFKGLSHSLHSKYNFIVLELKHCDEKNRGQLYIEITFERTGKEILLTKVYCEDQSRTDELKALIKENNKLHHVVWNETDDALIYKDAKLTEYLDIADSIASASFNCTSGDNYYPGFYSSISITEHEIVLAQINHMNSRSINHKEDYSLRKLEMYIPLGDKAITKRSTFDHYPLGDMDVYFSDSSSQNNKNCGDKILSKIQALKMVFDNKKN